MSAEGFEPAAVYVAPGAVVVWVVTATSSLGISLLCDEFEVLPLAPLRAGGRYEHRFEQTGTFTVSCKPPAKGECVVDVRAGRAAPPSCAAVATSERPSAATASADSGGAGRRHARARGSSVRGARRRVGRGRFRRRRRRRRRPRRRRRRRRRGARAFAAARSDATERPPRMADEAEEGLRWGRPAAGRAAAAAPAAAAPAAAAPAAAAPAAAPAPRPPPRPRPRRAG